MLDGGGKEERKQNQRKKKRTPDSEYDCVDAMTGDQGNITGLLPPTRRLVVAEGLRK